MSLVEILFQQGATCQSKKDLRENSTFFVKSFKVNMTIFQKFHLRGNSFEWEQHRILLTHQFKSKVYKYMWFHRTCNLLRGQRFKEGIKNSELCRKCEINDQLSW